MKDGTVIVGSDNNKIYVLKPDGNKKEIMTEGPVGSSPVVMNDGTVVVGSSDGNLYFLGHSGNKKISVATEGGGIRSSPIILRDGTVVVGSHG